MRVLERIRAEEGSEEDGSAERQGSAVGSYTGGWAEDIRDSTEGGLEAEAAAGHPGRGGQYLPRAQAIRYLWGTDADNDLPAEHVLPTGNATLC